MSVAIGWGVDEVDRATATSDDAVLIAGYGGGFKEARNESVELPSPCTLLEWTT